MLGCVATVSLAHAAQAPALNDQQFAALLADFQRAVDTERDRYRLPGITAAFVLPDGRMGKVASGFADVERHLTMTPDSRMPAPDLAESWTGSRIDVRCSPQASATIDRCTAQPPPARERAGKLEAEPFLDTLPVYRYRLEHRRTPRR